jgi:hypothetical protein
LGWEKGEEAEAERRRHSSRVCTHTPKKIKYGTLAHGWFMSQPPMAPAAQKIGEIGIHPGVVRGLPPSEAESSAGQVKTSSDRILCGVAVLTVDLLCSHGLEDGNVRASVAEVA